MLRHQRETETQGLRDRNNTERHQGETKIQRQEQRDRHRENRREMKVERKTQRQGERQRGHGEIGLEEKSWKTERGQLVGTEMERSLPLNHLLGFRALS